MACFPIHEPIENVFFNGSWNAVSRFSIHVPVVAAISILSGRWGTVACFAIYGEIKRADTE